MLRALADIDRRAPGGRVYVTGWPMLVLQGRNDPGATQVPLAYVQRVRVREYSRGKTAGLAVGLSLGGLTVIAGIAFIFIAQGLGSVR